MKVIVAGYAKTGTKSMNAALTSLGYKVYDGPENLFLLRKEYKKILRDGWTTEDWKQMYEDVDAIVDFPAFYFWEEIHKAFPDAKIILTVRDNEDVWVESFYRQMDLNQNNMILKMPKLLSPTYWRMDSMDVHAAMTIFGMKAPSIWTRKIEFNSEMMKLKYRSHNAHVVRNAPADKLLVYKCSQGWEPLCKFLETPIPAKPFPHKNVRGKILEEMIATDPRFLKAQKEALVSSVALITIFTVGGYFMYSVGPSNIYSSLIRGSHNLLKILTFGK